MPLPARYKNWLKPVEEISGKASALRPVPGGCVCVCVCVACVCVCPPVRTVVCFM